MGSNIRAGFSLRQFIHINSDIVTASINEDPRLKGDNYRMVSSNKDSTLSVWQFTSNSVRCVRKQKTTVKIESILNCATLNCYILLTNQNSLLFLDNNLVEIFRYVHDKAVTSIALASDLCLLFLGNDSQVDCFHIADDPHIRHQKLNLDFRYTILSTVQLPLTLIFVEEKRKKLILIHETSIKVFDMLGSEKYYNPKLCRRAVTALCFFEVPQLYVVSSMDGSLYVINESLMILNYVQAHQGIVTALRTHLNEAVVVSVGSDNFIRMFNIHNLHEMFAYDLSCTPITLAYLDNNSIAFQSTKTTGILEINTLTTPLLQLSSSVRILQAVAYSDPLQLVAISEEGLVRFVTMATGRVVNSIMPKSGIVAIKSISIIQEMDASFLLMDNGDIWIFLNSAKPCRVKEIWKRTMNDTVSSLATYKSKGKVYLIGSTHQGALLVFDSTGQIRVRIDSNKSPILSICIIGDTLVSFTTSTQAKIYTLHPESTNFFQVKTQRQLLVYPTSYSIMHNRVCYSGLDGVVHMTDFTKDSFECSHERNHDHFEVVTCVEGHAGDKIFLTAGLDGQIKCWDLSNTLVCTINLRFPIRAMCFANHAGDLVLGLDDKLETLSARSYRSAESIDRATIELTEIEEETLEDESSSFEDVDCTHIQQTVKLFGIETNEARLSILDFTPAEVIETHDIATVLSVTSDASSANQKDSRRGTRRMTILSLDVEQITFMLPLIEEVDVISTSLLSIADTPVELSQPEVTDPVIHATLAPDAQFPNSIFLNGIPAHNLWQVSEESREMQRERARLDELKANESAVNALEASKAYMEKIRILAHNKERLVSEEVLHESPSASEEMIAEVKVVEIEQAQNAKAPPKKKIVGNYTKKAVIVNMNVKVEHEATAVAFAEPVAVVEVVKKVKTISDTLAEAKASIDNATDPVTKVRTIQQMNMAYGPGELTTASPEFVVWAIQAYENVISGTTIDAWKMKMCLLNIFEASGFSSPWVVSLLFMTLVDELEELRVQSERILLQLGFGEAIHPFIKKSIISIIHENVESFCDDADFQAVGTENKRLLRHITTLQTDFLDNQTFTGNALDDIKTFITTCLQRTLCEKAKTKELTLQIKNLPPPTITSRATATENKYVSAWRSPTALDFVAALNDYASWEDTRLRKIEEENQLIIERAEVVRVMREKKKAELREKKQETIKRSIQRSVDKTNQKAKQKEMLAQKLLDRKDPVKIKLAEDERKHSRHSHRAGSPCHPSRETYVTGHSAWTVCKEDDVNAVGAVEDDEERVSSRKSYDAVRRQ